MHGRGGIYGSNWVHDHHIPYIFSSFVSLKHKMWLLKRAHFSLNKIIHTKKMQGPTGSRTQVAGFKVQSANHYTIEPLAKLCQK